MNARMYATTDSTLLDPGSERVENEAISARRRVGLRGHEKEEGQNQKPTGR